MNWFKETWWIIKQLFTKVKADKVQYKHMEHYPASGYSAKGEIIMACGGKKSGSKKGKGGKK